MAAALLVAGAGALVAACSDASSSSSTDTTAGPTPAHGADTTHVDPTPPYPTDATTVVVVGVTAESIAPIYNFEIAELVVSISVDGAPLAPRTVPRSALPLEIRVPAPAAKPDARVDVAVRALADASISGTVANDADDSARTLIRRAASTSFVAKETKLLRVALDSSCVENEPAIGGGTTPRLGPKCDAATTCVLGRCTSPAVAPEALETYDATWPSHPLPDPCAGTANPELVVGAGATALAPLADGDLVAVEAGPQGGYHTWLAEETRNVARVGAVTKTSGTWVSDGESLPPTSVVTPLTVGDAPGACGFVGLRLVLAPMGSLLCAHKGDQLDVTITVTETSGRSAQTTRRVRIPTSLPPVFGRDPCAPADAGTGG